MDDRIVLVLKAVAELDMVNGMNESFICPFHDDGVCERDEWRHAEHAATCPIAMARAILSESADDG